jgi:hypothetical protein
MNAMADKNGLLPLHWASQKESLDPRIFKLLIEVLLHLFVKRQYPLLILYDYYAFSRTLKRLP